MRSARRNLGAQLLMILVVLIGLGFGYSFAREVVQAQHLAGQAEASRLENERIAAENRKLQRDLQYYQSDAYAELRARTDLNMRRPDEQVILPVLPDGETTITSPDSDMGAQAAQAPANPVAPAPGGVTGRNWDRWLALFAGTAR
jgi:cell division protein FtsB